MKGFVGGTTRAVSWKAAGVSKRIDKRAQRRKSKIRHQKKLAAKIFNAVNATPKDMRPRLRKRDGLPS